MPLQVTSMTSSARCCGAPLAPCPLSSWASAPDLSFRLYGPLHTRRIRFISVVCSIPVARSGSTSFQIKLALPRLRPHKLD